MASLKEIRAAIKTTLESAVTGITVHRTVPGTVNVAAVVARPATDLTADFVVAMGRGQDTYRLDLLVLVSGADSEVAQDTLDELVTGSGDRSIRQAIFQNRTLGLADTDAHVSNLTAYAGDYTIGGTQYPGAVLRMIVTTSGRS